MTDQRSKFAQADSLFAKVGRILVVAWMVSVVSVYLHLLVSRLLRMAGALP
jgi:hypothetical protein